jgi:hypothetical protein
VFKGTSSIQPIITEVNHEISREYWGSHGGEDVKVCLLGYEELGTTR